MALKSHPLGKLAAIALLVTTISACELVPTPLGQSTPTSPLTDTLAPTLTQAAGGNTPIPSPTIEPTEDPSASLVDLSTLHSFFELDMIDARNGWAVTDLGLLRTSDGGSQWHLITPPQEEAFTSPLTYFFPDANSAYLLPIGQDFNAGVLYHTGDAGHSWSATNVPFSTGHLQFLDEQTGFALASLGAGAGSNPVSIFESNDGGLTWQQLFSTLDQEAPGADALGNSGIKSGFTFLDAQRGWVTGSVPVDNFVYLYATSDGGHTWQHQDVPLPDDGTTSFYSTEPPVFFNDTDGLLTAQQSPADSSSIKKAFFITHDGGATWQALPPVDGSGPVSTPTPTDWFFWNQGTLLVTHDAGTTWQEAPNNLILDEAPVSLVFTDPTTGWELHFTADSAIHFYTTTDGGQTWTPIIP